MVNKTSRTFNVISRSYFSAPDQKRVRWNMVPTNPPCCVLVPPVWNLPGLGEEMLNFRKTWDFHKMAEMISREGFEERVRSSELRSKLILLNSLVSINSDIAERMLSVILKVLFLTAERAGPPVASERAQPVSLAHRADSCGWLSGVRGGFLDSQLQLSKAETLLHFRLAEF